ncbi:exopolyphosphatase [Aspergillus luchuensis]|uniref:Exopolyphosphatase n=1 Tax=Aspergillus kawachii TaxID=1069201 RepID=A0A146FTS3_ASPKA|nr:exopolyphosphatase [Aspergillus luchuensis]
MEKIQILKWRINFCYGILVEAVEGWPWQELPERPPTRPSGTVQGKGTENNSNEKEGS